MAHQSIWQFPFCSAMFKHAFALYIMGLCKHFLQTHMKVNLLSTIKHQFNSKHLGNHYLKDEFYSPSILNHRQLIFELQGI
jgi:hypothetical protein